MLDFYVHCERCLALKILNCDPNICYLQGILHLESSKGRYFGENLCLLSIVVLLAELSRHLFEFFLSRELT